MTTGLLQLTTSKRLVKNPRNSMDFGDFITYIKF